MDNIIRIGDSDAFLLNVKNKVDNRGVFCKIYQESLFNKYINFDPKECYFSSSKQNVLRGFHLQINKSIHGKIVSCISGKVLDVLVDLRLGKNFGKIYNTILDSSDSDTIYIPKGYGHAFLNVESVESKLVYLVETEYSPQNDVGVKWNSVDFKWPIDSPIISERDNSFMNLENFEPLNL